MYQPCPSISNNNRTLSSMSPICCAHEYHEDRRGRNSESHCSRRYVFAIRSKKLHSTRRVSPVLDMKPAYIPYREVELGRFIVRLSDTVRNPQCKPPVTMRVLRRICLEEVVRSSIQLVRIPYVSLQKSSRDNFATDLEYECEVVYLLLVAEPRGWCNG